MPDADKALKLEVGEHILWVRDRIVGVVLDTEFIEHHNVQHANVQWADGLTGWLIWPRHLFGTETDIERITEEEAALYIMLGPKCRQHP